MLEVITRSPFLEMKQSILNLAVWVSVVFCTFNVLAQQNGSVDSARKFDEFGYIHYGDASARMDNLAWSLRSESNITAYISVYAGRDDYRGLSHRYAHRLKNYLVNHGIDPSRVVAIDGGRRDKQHTDIWLVPAGATPPAPKLALPAEPIPSGESLKFDEYPIAFPGDEDFDNWDGRYEDSVARLDAVAGLLKEPSDLRLHIIARAQSVYVLRAIRKSFQRGKRQYIQVRSHKLSDPTGTDRRLANEEKRYLVGKHGIEAGRIIAIGHGYNELRKSKSELLSREEAIGSRSYVARTIELWLVPSGAASPTLKRASK
jgi:hypothetical protein